jgi:hypothetical protein
MCTKRTLGLLTVGIVVGSAQPSRGASPGPRSYPLYCAGLVVGISREQDARRMFGDGVFVTNEGHGAARYYVDAKRRVTLNVQFGDGRVETVTYSRGLVMPAVLRKNGVPARAIARALRVDELAGGFSLGAPVSEVTGMMGKPKEHTVSGKRRVLRYETDHDINPYVCNYDAVFTFERGRLVS